MKNTRSLFLTGVALIALAMQLSSCEDKSTPFIGSWKSIAPINVSSQIRGAESALETLSFNFINSQQESDGTVTLSSHYSISGIPVSGNDKISFSAEATVDGTWTHDVDDQDDLLLDYDYSTIDVKIDKTSIVDMSSAPLSPARIDSIASLCTSGIKSAFQESLIHFSVVEDIEVSKDGNILSLEVKNPKQKLKFKRQNL